MKNPFKRIVIAKGSTRMVIHTGSWWVIKLPIIDIKESAEKIRTLYRQRRWARLRKELTGIEAWKAGVESDYIVKGIINNWKEFTYSFLNPQPYLMPTYYSHFGLINIQKRGEPYQSEYIIFGPKIDRATKGQVRADGHHFKNSQNFCLVDGKLVMIDYSNFETQKVLDKYGMAIHNALSNT